MDELLQQFVVEALELTQQAADDLLALEREPGNRARLESAFRAFHTLKGSVGLFDLAPMQRALHAAEELLAGPSKGTGELDAAGIGSLLDVVAWTEQCVRQLAEKGELNASEAAKAEELIGGLSRKEAAVADSEVQSTMAVPPWAVALFAMDPSPTAIALRYEPLRDCFFSGDDPVGLMSSVPGIVAAKITARDDWGDAQAFDPFRSNLVFEALSTAPRQEVEAAFRLLPDQVSIVARPAPRGDTVPLVSKPVSRTVRVDVERIDRLVDDVGELFTAKNAMSALVEEARRLPGGAALARSIAASQQEVDRLAGKLQRSATSVRMVPLDDMLRRLPRLAREVATQVGKTVDLIVEGGELEADKAIVDSLYDPLLHVIRNAIDHGIESAPGRARAGKPARGRVNIRARQLGYRIELQIEDDGAGVDVDRVRALAVMRGLVSEAEGEALDDAQVHELLFRSGFSTASGVTDVSGRGVGMDAVRDAVERLGGRVRLASERGAGTTVSVTVPTTIAMTRVMVVDAAGDRYGLAMDVISETTKVPAADIAAIRAGEAFVLRDRTVPIVRLSRLLGLPERRRAEELVLVADLAGGATGIIVDAIGERFETMLRPPAGLMQVVPGITGTTVLGDGSVIMMLDLEELIV